MVEHLCIHNVKSFIICTRNLWNHIVAKKISTQKSKLISLYFMPQLPGSTQYFGLPIPTHSTLHLNYYYSLLITTFESILYYTKLFLLTKLYSTTFIIPDDVVPQTIGFTTWLTHIHFQKGLILRTPYEFLSKLFHALNFWYTITYCDNIYFFRFTICTLLINIFPQI